MPPSSDISGIHLFVARHETLDPAFVRSCAARLSPEERAEFARMADPREADVRTALRAEAHRRRAAGMKVSVSHAGDFGVLAVSDTVAALGVDVEPWAGGTSSPELVREVTSPEEFSLWENLPDADRRPAFVRLWTLKEAAFKAGCSPDMKVARVSPDFLRIDAPGWSSSWVPADETHVVALVWSGDPVAILVKAIGDSRAF